MLNRRCWNDATYKTEAEPRFLCIILTPPTKHLCLEEWCLTGLENGNKRLKGLAWLATSLLVLKDLWWSLRDFYLQSIANIPFSN